MQPGPNAVVAAAAEVAVDADTAEAGSGVATVEAAGLQRRTTPWGRRNLRSSLLVGRHR